jgi:ATP phosphoribosyltransferase regulatory subunit
MTNSPSVIRGTRDAAGSALSLRRAAERAIEACFASFAYVPVAPPILTRAAPFLDRSGEDMRRRLYAFVDPGGRELCLRPELTIPTCRLYLDNLAGQEREARLSYIGPAFQFGPTGRARRREFWQAGVESIGATEKEAADAEVFALSMEAIGKAGIRAPRAILGDHEIVRTFIDGLSVGPRWKERLKRIVWNNGARDIEARLFSEGGIAEKLKGQEELLDALASMGLEKAGALIRDLLALAEVHQVGGRAVDEIADRLLASLYDRDGREAVSEEVLGGLRHLLEMEGSPEAVSDAIARHAAAMGVTTLEPILEKFERRLELVSSYGLPTADLRFEVGLRREVAYYTGFVFEVYAEPRRELGHICGGGRYDGLLQGLGARRPIPAAGFAIGLDRLAMALAEDGGERDTEPVAHAVVVGAGRVRLEDCIRVSTILRNHGWAVQTDMSGWRPKRAVAFAEKHKIPYVVFVGEDEMKAGQVRVRRLRDWHEQIVSTADLPRIAAMEIPAAAESAIRMDGRNAAN